jgi:NAD(P)-dependent dehydrogenase (short-subunit alcohol dehydrogenase family)
MARLTVKVALVTGAAGGQGASESELFVSQKVAVVPTDIARSTPVRNAFFMATSTRPVRVPAPLRAGA